MNPVAQNTADTKIKAFEYLTKKFIEWYESKSHLESAEINFSKLKLIKLHFFTSAVSANPDDDGLLILFNKFYALPYGHVESDVYNNLNQSRYVTITNNSIVVNDIDENYFDSIFLYKESLDNAIKSLRAKNENLVLYNAMDLVELSHTWYSWKTTFKEARSQQKFSLPIPNDLIKNEEKVYSLNKSIF